MNLSSARKTFTLITSSYYTCATVLHRPFDPPPFSSAFSYPPLSFTHPTSSRSSSHSWPPTKPFSRHKAHLCLCSLWNPTKSKLVFHSVELKSMYLWNSLINGYVKNCVYNKAFELFEEMCNCNVLPDDYTLATMAKVSGKVQDLVAGNSVHGKSIGVGFVLDTVVANSLMSMYCKCDNFGQCWKVFEKMPQRNAGSWNAIIAGYASSVDDDSNKEIREIAKCMLMNGVKPDGFTVSSILPLCGGDDIEKWDYGRALHCYSVKYELDLKWGSDVHLRCCLIYMYSRSSRVDLGRRVFDRMK